MTAQATSNSTDTDGQIQGLRSLIAEALRRADDVDCVVAAYLSAALVRLDASADLPHLPHLPPSLPASPLAFG